MTTFLFVIQIVLAVLIGIAVLMQKSSSMGLGAYSGSNESLFGAKGPAGFLAKTTFVLGFLFVANTVALGMVYEQTKEISIIDNVDIKSIEAELNATIPKASEAPQAPAVPKN